MTTDRRSFLRSAALGLAAGAASLSAQEKPDRPKKAKAAGASAAAPAPAALSGISKAGPGAPNILLILAEDIGPELSCYPENGASAHVRTPNIDRLAREGVRCTQCFTTSPVCSPSRSALMTGMYQTSIGAHNHRTWSDAKPDLPPGVFTLTDYFRAAGYHTCNLTKGRRRDPATGVRLPTGGDGSGKTDLNFICERPFDSADWADRAAGQAFFAQITINESHKGDGWPLARRSPERVPRLADPASVPVPPYYPDEPEVRDEIANYLDAIMLMDSYVGDVLARLERDGLLESTVVVFMGDNGQCLARGKQFLYDGGVHVPLVIRWPDRRRAGSVDRRLISSIDVSAALLGLAGIRPLPAFQGRDFLAADATPRAHVFAARDRMDVSVDRMRAVRTDRYKYIRNYHPATPYLQHNAYKEKNYPTWNLLRRRAAEGRLTEAQRPFAAATKPIEELYDLPADPHEVRNLASDPGHAATLKRLRALVDDWLRECGDTGAVGEDPVAIFRGYNGHLPEDPPPVRAGGDRS